MFLAMQDDMVRCDVDPFLPRGWKKWDTHKTSDSFSSNSNKVLLHQCKIQETQRVVKLSELVEGELARMPVCNANVLDYYFNRPFLVSEEWKKWRIFFPGTLYRDDANFPVVRFLSFEEGQWYWGKRWIELPVNQECRFAVLKEVPDRH